MSNAISVRIQPKDFLGAVGQRAHDLRTHAPAYVDGTRSMRDNSVVVEPPDPAALRAEMAANRKASGQRGLRKDARIFISGIITLGKEAQATLGKMPKNEQEKNEQDAVFLRVAERMARESGHPLIGLVVHRDESAVHAHFTLRGCRSEGGKEIPWRYPSQFMSQLQDAAAEEVAHLGVERGKRKIERVIAGEPKSKWVYRSVRELHNDLPGEIEALKKQIEEAEAKREKNERLALAAEKKGKEVAEIYRRREEAADVKLRELNAALESFKKTALPPLPKLAPKSVEVVTKHHTFSRNETAQVKFVPIEQVSAYQKARKEREEQLLRLAAQEQEALAGRKQEVAKREAEIESRETAIARRETAIADREAEIEKRESEIKGLAETVKTLPNAIRPEEELWEEIVDRDLATALSLYERAPFRFLVFEQVRYHVAVKIMPGRVIVPAQSPAATEAQIAAALYRVTRERAREEGWGGIVFTVPDKGMADRLLEMAKRDGIERGIEIMGRGGRYFFHPGMLPEPDKSPQIVPQRQLETDGPRFRM